MLHIKHDKKKTYKNMLFILHTTFIKYDLKKHYHPLCLNSSFTVTIFEFVCQKKKKLDVNNTLKILSFIIK